MIKTSRQLKDKIKNYSGNDGQKAQVFLRNYMMERFLERISVSEYREKFILKGGMLVASLIGLEMRSTMDIDTTVRAIDLTLENAEKVINEIISIDIGDGIVFTLKSSSDIMEEHDYPGLRFVLDATLEKLRQPIKIDISTGDVITPAAVQYSYKLMMEDRSIPIYTYNVETLLGEKLETIIARSTANTRMRDFYDIYVIMENQRDSINISDLKDAFIATCRKRESLSLLHDIGTILTDVENNEYMKSMWNDYRKKNYFVGALEWHDTLSCINALITELL